MYFVLRSDMPASNNLSLFNKQAYIEGRAGTENPAAKWYEGEIGFFDFYIIPLAKKLKNCGVFGVSSDEYLNYALQNRKEWELNGVKVVEAMIGEMRSKHRAPQPPQDSVDDQASHASGGQRSHASGKLSAPGFKAVPVPVRPISKSGSSPELTGLVQSVNFSKQEAPLEKLPDIMKVLVVDDDKITRKMFARGVKKIVPQWIIQEAASGEEALEVLASNEANCFDLIFMDHYMGTDNKLLLGSDAVAEARKRGIQSKICGMSANDVEELFDDAGADEFIFKPLPFRPEPLTRELLRILSNGDDWGGM